MGRNASQPRRGRSTLVLDRHEHSQLEEVGGTLSLPSEGVLLARGKKKLRAFSTACPHKPKNQVELDGPGSKRCFRCKAHNWTWDRKGRPRGKAQAPLKRLDLEVRDSQIFVRLD